MANIIERSFKSNIAIMTFLGLYPDKSAVSSSVRGYAFYFFFLILVTTLIFIKMLQETDSDTSEIIFNMVFVADATAFWFKLFPFLKYGDRIKRCINFFGDPKFAPQNTQEEAVIEECIHVCRRNSMVFLYGIIFCQCTWSIPLLIQQKLSLQVWLPYDPNSTNIVFYVSFLYIFLGAAYVSISPMIDPLIGGLVYHATCQIKNVKDKLRHFDEHLQNLNGNSTVEFGCACKFLTECIEHHNGILSFISEFEACFSFPVLCQFAGSLFGLPLCGIILMQDSVSSIDYAKGTLCFFVVIFQILFYCYYGTLLFEENNQFINAIYMGPWYKYDNKIRKTLILMMERSKRPTIVTAGKVVNLTLQTFTSVLKTSWSLIALLKSFQ